LMVVRLMVMRLVGDERLMDGWMDGNKKEEFERKRAEREKREEKETGARGEANGAVPTVDRAEPIRAVSRGNGEKRKQKSTSADWTISRRQGVRGEEDCVNLPGGG
jgi:uncharacterized protein YdaU (DUF1376 family)